LLLTNDGDWANHLMHPRYQSEKEYLVWTKRQLSLQHLGDLKAGVKIDGKTLRMKGIKLHDQSDNIYQIILTEGHKRQIRVMIEHVGNEVVRLQRFREDQYRLGDLPPGQVREIKI